MLCWIPFITFGAEYEFTVDAVGISNSTNTFFITTLEDIPSNSCPVNRLFRAPSNDENTDRFLAIALTAQTQDKKLTIDFEANECLSSGTLIRVIKLTR